MGSDAPDILKRLEDRKKALGSGSGGAGGSVSDAELLRRVFGSGRAARAALREAPPPAQAPDGIVTNPFTGQVVDRDLLRARFGDMSAKGAAVSGAVHGGTLGFSDEAAWLGGFLRGLADGVPPKEAARYAMALRRAQVEAAREQHPVAEVVGEVAGGAAIPATVFRSGGAAKSAGEAARRAATTGATTGAIYGFGDAEGSPAERFRDVPAGAAAGAVGGMLAVPVGQAVIWGARKFGVPVGRVFSSRTFYQEGRGLTPAGREALRAIGVDPDEVSEEFAKAFSRRAAEGVEPDQAAAAAEMDEFGIPAFRHNVTGNVDDFADFERAVRGGAGRVASERVGRAADRQQMAARKAVDDFATGIGGGQKADALDAAMAVSERVDEVRAAERAAAQAAYDAADKAGVAIDAPTAKGIVQRLQTRLADEEIDLTSDAYGRTRRFMQILENRAKGDQPVSLRKVDRVRKDVVRAMRDAEPEDMRALKILKDEYDAWMDGVIASRLFTGDEAGFEELRRARGLWADYAKRFAGKDAPARFVQDVIRADASPEQVVTWLFGAGKLGSGRFNSKIASGLREILGPDSQEWNMVRQAAFRRLTQKPGTEAVGSSGVIPWGPQKVAENIEGFLGNPRTRPLAQTLFSRDERLKMERLARALRRMVPPKGAVNYSNTQYEQSRMAQKMYEGILAAFGAKTGGPAGAVGAVGAGRAAGAARGWLTSKRVLGRLKRAGIDVRPAAAGGVGGAALVAQGEK